MHHFFMFRFFIPEKFFLISSGLVSFCDILDPIGFQMVNVCKHKIYQMLAIDDEET